MRAARIAGPSLLLLSLSCAGPRNTPPPAGETKGPPEPVDSALFYSDPRSRDSVPLADLRSDLAYDITLGIVEDSILSGAYQLHANATVTNVSARSVRLTHSACVVEVLAYRDSGRIALPVWDSRQRAIWPSGSIYGCALPLIRAELAPGQSYRGSGIWRFRARIPVAEIYADSLPTGRYFIDAVLNLNGDRVRRRAGSVVLPRSRFYLGPEYPLDGFRYRVAVERLASGSRSFVIHVRVSSAGMRPDLTRYVPRECPIVLHAYRSAEAQRTAPPAPIWASPRRCAGLTPEPIQLRSGESRTLRRRFSARDVLGDSLQPGRYYFTAIVPLVDPRQRGLSRRVWLDAGVLDLR